MTDNDGVESGVHHIQTTGWKDLTAPEESKILLDLVYETQELANKIRGKYRVIK